MSYQVFARKYRPQVFDDVLGQDHVVRTLKNAIEQMRLAHAYLFVGPRGTGKTSTARILAKALNCVHGPTVRPCGVCDSCKEISQGISLDVLEIDGASNNSVDQVRELRENVRFAPVSGRFKVYIIDEVHMLTSQAFNALLKTLEEPPQHVLFIFATTEPNKVLPTILSRCQRFDLRRIPPATISQHLSYIAQQENLELSKAAAEALAIAADGGLRDAESMLDQLVAFRGNQIDENAVLEVFGLTSESVVADLAQAVISNKTATALTMIGQQDKAGKDLGKLLVDLLVFLRHLLVARIDPDSVRDELGERSRQMILQLADQIDLRRLLQLTDALATTDGAMRWASNKKLSLEMGIIRAMQTIQQVGLNEIVDALESLRGSETPSGVTSLVANQISREADDRKPKPADPVSLHPEHQNAITRSPGEKPSIQSKNDQQQPKPRQAPESQVNPEQTERAELSMNELWMSLLAEIQKARPLMISWLSEGVPVGLADHALTIGFPAERQIAMENVNRPGNRKMLEAVLGEKAGTPIAVRAEIRSDLAVIERKPREDPATDFKNDPRIQKALEIFRAEIESEN